MAIIITISVNIEAQPNLGTKIAGTEIRNVALITKGKGANKKCAYFSGVDDATYKIFHPTRIPTSSILTYSFSDVHLVLNTTSRQIP